MSGGARNRVPGLVDGKSIYGDTTIEDTLEDSEDLTEVTKGLLSELLIPHNLNQSSSNDAEVPVSLLQASSLTISVFLPTHAVNCALKTLYFSGKTMQLLLRWTLEALRL